MRERNVERATDGGAEIFRWLTGGLAGAVGWLLGGYDAALSALAVVWVCELALALLADLQDGRTDADKCWGYITKKVATWPIVVAMQAVDAYLNADGLVRTAIIGSYIFVDVTRMAFSAAVLGAPIPQPVLDLLNAYQKPRADALTTAMQDARDSAAAARLSAEASAQAATRAEASGNKPDEGKP